MGQIKQMMQMVRTASNPQAVISQLMASNPRMQEVKRIVEKHGGDPMKAFRAEAEARGVDPEEILSMLR